jgi:hypothetical protein
MDLRIKDFFKQRTPLISLFFLYTLFCTFFLKMESWMSPGSGFDLFWGLLETIQVAYSIPIIFCLFFGSYFLISLKWQKRNRYEILALLGVIILIFFAAKFSSPCARRSFEGKIMVFMCERYYLFKVSLMMSLCLGPIIFFKQKLFYIALGICGALSVIMSIM